MTDKLRSVRQLERLPGLPGERPDERVLHCSSHGDLPWRGEVSCDPENGGCGAVWRLTETTRKRCTCGKSLDVDGPAFAICPACFEEFNTGYVVVRRDDVMDSAALSAVPLEVLVDALENLEDGLVTAVYVVDSDGTGYPFHLHDVVAEVKRRQGMH